MKDLRLQIDELSSNINRADLSNTTISKAPIAWHIHHSLAVIIGISKALADSNPEDYKFKIKLLRMFIMASGIIPRGKGKAPDRVNKREHIYAAELEEMGLKAHEAIEKLAELPKNSFFNHPYFGHLDRNAAIRFLKIHTKHHLKIIREIITAEAQNN